jgi:hypothetical protein
MERLEGWLSAVPNGHVRFFHGTSSNSAGSILDYGHQSATI